MNAVRRRSGQTAKETRSLVANPRSDQSGSSARSTSSPTTIELRGVHIHFPFRPYACQNTYMEKVIDALNRSEHALLESPTGTGKTLCLLCSALAWQREQSRLLNQARDDAVVVAAAGTHDDAPAITNAGSRVPTIIYASRTHSQLSQVVRELRSTRYRPKHAVLGSRDQMCVNPKVKTQTASSSDVNHGCSVLNKERKCRFRNNLESFSPPSNESAGSGGGHPQVQPVMDMEDLVSMGNKHRVCPFYYTRSLVADAELVLIPYNYLFDRDARENSLADICWDGAVVIFDEAHNLESFASESASFDLTSVDVGGCVGEVNRAMNYVQAMPELTERIKVENLARLKAVFLHLEEYMEDNLPSSDKGNAYSGDYIFEIFSKGAAITYEKHAVFVDFVRQVTDLIMEMRGGTTGSSGAPRLDHFVNCLKRVFGETTEAKCIAKARAYRVYISAKQPSASQTGRTLSYWCFAPSLSMHELAGLKIRSIIVTSGTLSPLPSYSLELGLNFPHTLENPHIIQREQIHVRVIGRGVSGKDMNSSYNRRDDGDYLTELGNTLVSLARVIPGGMLVFFPSYSVMESCIERWGGPVSSRSRRSHGGNHPNNRNAFFARRQSSSAASGGNRYSFPHVPDCYSSTSDPTSTPWKRLLKHKAVVVEPKSTTDLRDAIAEFERYIDQPRSTGCVLMGVCRGKISEGIDFAHEKCRAVVITGIPFAPFQDPKVKLKREFLDGVRSAQSIKASGEGGFSGAHSGASGRIQPGVSNSLTGMEWYRQQAHRAVNQAVGRVIRNKHDYGAILLLDSRFGEPGNQIGLSKWVRPYVQNDEGFGAAIGSLVKFYREAEKKAAELKEAEREAACGPVRDNIVLAYEKEDHGQATNEDVNTTKIAFIQRKQKIRAAAETSEDTATSVRDASPLEQQSRCKETKNSMEPALEGNTPTVEDDDALLLRGYVRPERVLKRVDLNDSLDPRSGRAVEDASDDGNRKHSEDHDKQDGTEAGHRLSSHISSDLTAVYSAAKSSAQFDRKQLNPGPGTVGSVWSGLGQRTSHAPASEPSTNSRSTAVSRLAPTPPMETVENEGKAPSGQVVRNNQAVQFFETARRQLSECDFSSVKKALKTLKRHGDQQDETKYISATRELLVLLVKYDNFDVRCQRSSDGDGPLLDLLFPLLPSRFRQQIEEMALKFKFSQSKFLAACKKSLPPSEYMIIRSSVPALLVDGAGSSSPKKSKYPTQKEYLAEMQPVLEILMKGEARRPPADGASVPSLVGMLCQMIPQRYSVPVRALIEEMKRAQNVRKMKAADHNEVGEKCVNPALFRSSHLSSRQSSRGGMGKQLGEAKHRTQTIPGKALNRMQVEKPGTCNAEPRNPYAANQKGQKGQRGFSLKSLLPPPKRVKNLDKSKERKSSAANDQTVAPIKNRDSNPSDPLAVLLERATSKTLHKPRMKKSIETNVPEGFTCTVCDNECREPFLADCGHSACITCWRRWLQKSSTCPVCRSPTSTDNLAQMVFEKKAGAGAPSLSQMYTTAADSCESEEELEVVTQNDS